MQPILKAIALLRRQKGFKQSYMAHKLNITEHAYANIERERTTLTVQRFMAIARILNCAPADIMQMAEAAEDAGPAVIYETGREPQSAFYPKP